MATNAHHFGVSLLVLAAAVLAAGFVVLVGAEPAWAADRNLSPAPNSPFAVGSGPRSVTSADFNGDGKKDVAVANYGIVYSSPDFEDVPGSLSVLLGNGDGTFLPAHDIEVGTDPHPWSITHADLNGDGFVDLAVANRGSNNVSILLGNGDGTFDAKTDFAVGSTPFSVTSANLNADNFVDLAVANRDSDTVSVLFGQDLDGDGKGDGTFQAPRDVRLSVCYRGGPPCIGPVVGGPNQVVSADLDGDGDADLATANAGRCDSLGCSDSSISALLNNGNGFFSAKVTDVGLGVDYQFLTALHADAGPITDLVATSNGQPDMVSVLRGNGNGTFQVSRFSGVATFLFSVSNADFNADGKADLAIATYDTHKVSVLLGNGDGTFQPKRDFAVGSYPVSVTSADFNGDTFADLAVANADSNNVSVLLNTPADTTPTDTTAPSITLTTPPEGATYALNQTVAADYSCQDEADGSGVASCQGTVPDGAPLNTAPSGTKTFTVSASDNAGNISSVTHTYTVVSSGQCTLSGKSSTAETITGTPGDDVICGGAGPDTIRGMGGNDTLKGEAGNDKLLGGLGNDAFDGGLGIDTASYSASLTAVIASLAANSSTGEGSDTFTGVENLLGSPKADTLTGSSVNNTLTGGGGNDTGRGGAGNDKVVGSGGADFLYGEDGADAVTSKDGVNGNDSLDGGSGTDTKVTDTTEKSVVGFP